MIETPTQAAATGALRFMTALHQAYNEPGHRRTAHGPNPRAETIAADPENKRAMDQTVDALHEFLHQVAANYRQVAESALQSQPEHAAIVRQAILPILEPAHLAGCLDTSILAMGAADHPDMRAAEAENPEQVLANHRGRLQLALTTAQRTVYNLLETLNRSLWNATTAVGRATIMVPTTQDTMYQLKSLIRLLVRSLNESAKEAVKPLNLSWHNLERYSSN